MLVEPPIWKNITLTTSRSIGHSSPTRVLNKKIFENSQPRILYMCMSHHFQRKTSSIASFHLNLQTWRVPRFSPATLKAWSFLWVEKTHVFAVHSYPTCWAWRHTVALCWKCRKSSPFHPNTPQRLLAATRLRDPAMHWHSQQRSRGISISPEHAWYVVSHDLLRHFVRIEFEPEQFFQFWTKCTPQPQMRSEIIFFNLMCFLRWIIGDRPQG